MTTKYHAIIAKHFLPAIINGDYTGLTDDEEKLLDLWLEDYKGFIFDTPQDDETNISFCEITGLMSDCSEIFILDY